MSAYTPAPWYVYDDVDGAAIGHRAIVDADGFTICNPSPMGDANARLIANAPALAEALAWALDQIDDDPDPDHRAALDHARDVLARALGAEL
jgi:hypothetical protein